MAHLKGGDAMKRLLMTIAAVAALGGGARADIPPPGPNEGPADNRPPAEKACDGKKPGDACSSDGVAGACAMGRLKFFRQSDKKEVEVDALLCRPKDAKKKSSQRDGTAPFMLAFGIAACGAGVIAVRRRHRSA